MSVNTSYDKYKLFCAVAECSSITLAAERLYISQPAVSQGIRALEEALGCPLFTRGPKGVSLTAEGRVLYAHASKAMCELTEEERIISSMRTLEAGEIRIGASDMTLEFCLLPYLEKFHTKYPGVRISITNNPTPQTVELLHKRLIDFAAVSEPVDAPEFEKPALREISDIFICKSDDSAPDGLPISALSDRLILLEENTSTRRYIESEFKKRSFTISPKFELATSGQIVSFVARGMGIGCVVEDFATRAINDGTVRRIAVADPLPKRSICILRDGRERSLAASELLKMIEIDRRFAK